MWSQLRQQAPLQHLQSIGSHYLNHVHELNTCACETPAECVWGSENCARAPSCGGRQNCGHIKTSHKEQIFSRTVELIERKKQRMDRGTACLKKKRTKSPQNKTPWCWEALRKKNQKKIEVVKKNKNNKSQERM